MTETQAKSGGSGTSTTPPVDGEPKKDGSTPAGAGRTAVPADAPSPPKFTRAPGMAPPPGDPAARTDGPAEPKRPGPPAATVKGSATVPAAPAVTKGKGAAPGTQSGRTAVQPAANPAQRPGGTPVGRPTEAPGKRPGPGGVTG